jgi:hypothetical protein
MLARLQVLLSRHQNAGQNRDMKEQADRLKMSSFKYLGTTVRNKNLVQEEVKRRTYPGNACCHSAQNLVFSSAVHKRKNQNMQRYNFVLKVCL